LKLTTTPSSKASLDLREHEVPTEDVTEMVTKVPVGEKDGPAIIPAIFRPCPEVCWQHGMPKRKDCGGGQFHRLAENVEAVTAFVVDLDTGLTEEGLDELVEALKATGLEFWWWQTHSHTPEVAKGRLLIPFHRPFPLKSPEQWSRGAWPRLVQYLGVEGACSAVGKGADPSCRDPSRLYYMPRRPTEDAVRAGGYVQGKALNWEELFGDTLESFREAVKAPVAVGTEDPNAVVTAEHFEKLREDLKSYAVSAAPSKRKAIENVLKGKMPAELPTSGPRVRFPGTPCGRTSRGRSRRCPRTGCPRRPCSRCSGLRGRTRWARPRRTSPRGRRSRTCSAVRVRRARGSAPNRRRRWNRPRGFFPIARRPRGSWRRVGRRGRVG
jgi:hypothetical protein